MIRRSRVVSFLLAMSEIKKIKNLNNRYYFRSKFAMSISTRSCYGFFNDFKFSSLFFYVIVPCFHCKSKPATIKCFTCRPSQGSDIEKLCYRCDSEIHSSDIGSHSHNKEFIPFTGKRTLFIEII